MVYGPRRSTRQRWTGLLLRLCHVILKQAAHLLLFILYFAHKVFVVNFVHQVLVWVKVISDLNFLEDNLSTLNLVLAFAFAHWIVGIFQSEHWHWAMRVWQFLRYIRGVHLWLLVQFAEILLKAWRETEVGHRGWSLRLVPYRRNK